MAKRKRTKDTMNFDVVQSKS